jgi:hypothetical protein
LPGGFTPRAHRRALTSLWIICWAQRTAAWLAVLETGDDLLNAISFNGIDGNDAVVREDNFDRD